MENKKHKLVGAPRFELGTSCAQESRATQAPQSPSRKQSRTFGPTVGPLSVSGRSKCYLVLLKMPRKLLTHRSLQTCQGSGVGSIPIGRSIIQKNLCCGPISSAIFTSVTFFGSWPWKHSHARAESDSRPRALSKYISDERGRSQFFFVNDLF